MLARNGLLQARISSSKWPLPAPTPIAFGAATSTEPTNYQSSLVGNPGSWALSEIQEGPAQSWGGFPHGLSFHRSSFKQGRNASRKNFTAPLHSPSVGHQKSSPTISFPRRYTIFQTQPQSSAERERTVRSRTSDSPLL